MFKLFKRHPLVTAYFSAWTLFFTVFWLRAFFVDAAGNVVAGQVNIWGDWTAHFTMGSSMAYRKLFLTTSPLLINASFGYPFFANFLSALLIRLGVDFFAAFVWPSLIFSLLGVVALFIFYVVFLHSRRVALLSSLIFFLNGGLFFLKEPTRIPPFLDSLLIPQRALTHGFPLMLAALVLVIAAKKRILPVIGAGIILGFMPIIHTHSFLAAFVILALWAMGDKNRIKSWAILFCCTTLLAVPLIKIFLVRNIGENAFFQWMPGWYAGEDQVNFLWFWIKNWGIVPLIAVVGFVWFIRSQSTPSEKRAALFKGLPFFILFAVVNLFLFQPWIFDNTKLFIWAAVGMSGFAGYFIFRLPRLWGTALFLFSILSGLGHAAHLLHRSAQSFIMYSPEEIFLADWAKKNTDPASIWVQGERYHSWLSNLTGRQVVFSHPTLLWSHGYDYHQTQKDNRAMLRHPERKELFTRYKVDYIVVGKHEIETAKARDSSFEENFPLIIRTENYSVYATGKEVRRFEVLGLSTAPVSTKETLDLPMSQSNLKNLKPGLTETIYPGIYFHNLRKKINRNVSNINFQFDANQPRFFKSPCSIEWSGYLEIPREGTYKFKLGSDDGSFLFIDGEKVIENGGRHTYGELSRRVELSRGYHDLQIKYFDWGGGATLDLQWTPPVGMENPDLSRHLFSRN